MTGELRKISAILIVLLAAVTFSVGFVDGGDGAAASELSRVHRTVAARYPNVAHVTTTQLAKSGGRHTLLFDVRERDEFAVSHLADAVRVSPDITERDFLANYGDRVTGLRVVFYCSVGMRSSALAQRVQDVLIARGARSVRNLQGGLFQWRNERRRLTRNRSVTTAIHPYNTYWGRLIDDKTAIRYVPD
ncbi:MAG: rhodanese-like domain-containing protein [Hyphomicrobiaceae bacterium]